VNVNGQNKQRVVSLLRGKSGRPSVVDEKIKNRILELYWGQNIGLRKIADFVGVSTMTVWREIHEREPYSEVSQ